MNKYMLLILMVFGLISCSEKGEKYYLSNPKALEQALKTCQTQKSGLSCQQLENIGKKMNGLAFQLQSNPQAFGNKIVKLQQNIASLQEELNKNNSSELKTRLNEDKKELADLLAIVKWLESPENS